MFAFYNQVSVFLLVSLFLWVAFEFFAPHLFYCIHIFIYHIKFMLTFIIITIYCMPLITMYARINHINYRIDDCSITLKDIPIIHCSFRLNINMIRELKINTFSTVGKCFIFALWYKFHIFVYCL